MEKLYQFSPYLQTLDTYLKEMTAKRFQTTPTFHSPESKNKRFKANQRERARMHSLNKAYDRLRDRFPVPQVIGCFGQDECKVMQKLSKIETLRLACNYIQLLADVLENEKKVTKAELVDRLSVKISSMTSNLIKTRLEMDPELIDGLIWGNNGGQEDQVED